MGSVPEVFPNDKQDAGYDGEDGHPRAQIREAQVDQRNEPGQDEPHTMLFFIGKPPWRVMSDG